MAKILLHLIKHPSVSPTQIAEFLDLDISNTSAILSEFHEKGLIKKIAMGEKNKGKRKKDRRRIIILPEVKKIRQEFKEQEITI